MKKRECPFCGSMEVINNNPIKNSWSVQCEVCGATGPLWSTAKDSLEGWNQRHTQKSQIITPDTPAQAFIRSLADSIVKQINDKNPHATTVVTTLMEIRKAAVAAIKAKGL